MTRWSLRLPLLLLALLALMISVEGLLIAQDAGSAPETKKPADTAASAPDTKTIRFTSPNVRSAPNEKNGKIRVTTIQQGTAYQEDSTFSADVMVVESQDKVHTITCTGNPVFTDTETRITGDKVVAHSSPRWAEFTGNVKMVATPKKKSNAGEMKEKFAGEPTTVTSNSLSYDYGNKVAQARGSVVVVQKNRTLWADEGAYDQKAELITLKGNVKMKNTGDEELREMKNAQTVTVSLENDWIDIVAPQGGLVEFILEVKDEENKPAPEKK